MAETAVAKILLTAKQTADALSISKPTLWRWAKQGTLPPIRIGRCTRWPADQVHAFVERQKAKRDQA